MELLPLSSLPADKVEQSSPSHVLQEEEDAVGGGLVVVQQPNHVGTPPLEKIDYAQSVIMASPTPFPCIELVYTCTCMNVWHFAEMVNKLEHLKELMLYTYVVYTASMRQESTGHTVYFWHVCSVQVVKHTGTACKVMVVKNTGLLTGVLLVVAFDLPLPTAAMACRDL